ncbi:DUF2303 family protein [Pseudomonas japonica]|uniref:DUF2303 family protein n=1 Tax=Pseudomonas japonica TaxID=256466 RepID=UPI0015E33DC8|nr:DUF2303 family protein [Pseudomonas japonica]MBA1243417.1 DUF2303 family protein [Pseudomonas japonica]MBA1290534.1 DUF2303 family protein [Pseudomonas japonica]
MSLSKEAIQLINDNALAAAGKPLPTVSPTVLIPEGTKIVDLERYADGRSRFRGTYSTDSLADFGGYVVDRGHALAQGFVDQRGMSCKVFFNLGNETDPGHADDTAVLKLQPTAGFKAVEEINGHAMSQRDLSDWIEDWNTNIRAFDVDGNEMNSAKVIAAVRNITIKAISESDHAVGETKSSRSAMDQIEASSKETLPTNLVFSAVPYEGLMERIFAFRIAVLTSGSQPVLKLRWVGEEVQREEIAQEFKKFLQDLVKDKAKLRIGGFVAN